MAEHLYNILLIEDSVQEAALTQKALESADADVKIHIAHDGEDALGNILYRGKDRIEFPPLDLILLDLNMPRTDGMTVLNILKTNSRSCHLPIIVLSGSTDKADISASFQSGAVSYVSKPVNYTELAKAIKALISYWRLKKGAEHE